MTRVADGPTVDAMQRSAPISTPMTAFYWDGLSEHEIRLQRCIVCRTFRHPPGPRCPTCGSQESAIITSTGRGEVYAVITPRRPQALLVEEDFTVALVELEEGARLLSNVVGIPASEVAIGMAVTATYGAYDGFTLAQFRPAAPDEPEEAS